MAMLISRATGNFTAAATWGVADSATGSQNTTPSASTNTTTSYVYSSTFTGTNASVSDGIVLFLKRLTTTGTVTVALSDDNGVTATRSVTVNASDLPADESWVFFKFGSTLTLDGGTDYRVGVVASSADNALIYRDATAGNWIRMVSTTTTGAPAAGDTMLIVGEWTGVGASSSYTVTMDNTNTTDFGIGTTSGTPTQTFPSTYSGVQIGQNGTLVWGTSATTNYYLKLSGHLSVWSGGTYNMGTSGTPCPRDSTMTLLFDSTGNSTTTAFAFAFFNGSSVSVYGQSRSVGKNIVQCKLTADAAANATSLTVDTDTGWLDNDEIVVASTTRTASECELGALNGAAGASTLTVDGFAGTAGGLAFAHSGTTPTQAEIINLTRNVTIRGNSLTQPMYIRVQNITSMNVYWCRFLHWANTPTTIILSSINPVNFYYCAFSGAGSSLDIRSTGTIDNCVFHAPNQTSGSVIAQSTNPLTMSNTTIIRTGGANGISHSGITGTALNGIVAAGCAIGVQLNPGAYTINNITSHSNSSNGVAFTNSTTDPLFEVTATNITSWRNTGSGFSVSIVRTTVTNGLFFGNSTSSVSASITSTFNSCTLAGDTSFSTPTGLNISAGSNQIVTLNNCSLSPTSGIYVPHTTTDIALGTSLRYQLLLNNTLLGAATEITSPAQLSATGFIKSSKHDQTEGAFKSWFQGGIVERDTTIFNTASPSERLTPSSASIKLASGSRVVAVDDLGTVTINAYVRKSVVGDGAAYNGSQPRLILKANPACGINTDTVLATMSAAAGSWQQLTGTTAAVDADGALEFYVDCDGTAGWVNVDDWSVT